MSIDVGEIVEGKVTGITNFGVFVDLGDGKSGMVHISEVAQTYVSEIRDHVKENDVVKMKVLNITDDGKISLSIKRAMEPIKRPVMQQRPMRSAFASSGSAPWQKKNEPATFEDMLTKFKQTSDDKFSDLKKKNPDSRRQKRGSTAK
ncbi:MAG: S1 RNA-binding domain-containing protein [Oscillospiraceae bacterium]|nr:S1 RNA-binding domain-containing protein [Oscillospiraceae bacterium]